MTTYYKGNNIGLNYDAAAGSWSFTNTPKDFIDPNAFSTPDPVFPTAPTTPTTPDPTPDPCPAGYVYDEALKQCVPDPNYQNPFRQDNQGGGQDDNNTGTGLDPFNQAPQYKAGATGGASLVPTEDSGIDYNIFNYGTYAPTRAQMNEFMLINFGIEKGWLSYDDEKDAYRKIQFQEQIDPTAREIVGSSWAMKLLQADAYRNYKDYFELLEKGYQPSSNQNVWKKWIQGDSVYSLTGGMTFKEMSTRGGRGSDVTYINFSNDFKKKINQAMSIKDNQGNVKGIIDRDGNVNVRADDQGGYYDSNGNYTGADGSKGSNLLKGMQYLINLQNSGIELPDNLKKRLFKGINSAALTNDQKTAYANQLGFESWNKAEKKLNEAISNDDWWKKDDEGIIKINDASSATDVNIDNINEDGTIDNQVQDDKDSGYSNYEQDTVSTGSGSSGSGFSYGTGSSEEYDKFESGSGSSSSGSSSSGSSSSGNNYPNTPPPGTPPSSPPSSAGEAFKRYGRF